MKELGIMIRRSPVQVRPPLINRWLMAISVQESHDTSAPARKLQLLAAAAPQGRSAGAAALIKTMKAEAVPEL